MLYDECMKTISPFCLSDDVEALQSYRQALYKLYKLSCHSDDKEEQEKAMQHLILAAEHGHVEALFELADMRENQPNIYDFSTDILPLYQQAAAADHPDSLYRIAYRMLIGFEMPQDIAGSISRLERASQLGHDEAMIGLATIYIDGDHVEKDPAKAIDLLKQALDYGNPKAHFLLAQCLEIGFGFDANLKKAVTHYRKAATLGSVSAMEHLSNCYLIGHGVKTNSKTAISWLKKALAHGSEDAALKLAKLYEEGIFIDCVPKQAVYYYIEAAKKGSAEARFYIAESILESDLPVEDEVYAVAIEILHQLADDGMGAAFFMLGVCYLLGKTGEIDRQLSLSYFMKGAEMGHDESQCVLAQIYEEGMDFPRDLRRARSLYEQAANQGNIEAMRALANMYAQGKGGKKDRRLAQHWLQAAEAAEAEEQNSEE